MNTLTIALTTLVFTTLTHAAIVDRNGDGIPDNTSSWNAPEPTEQNAQGFRPSHELARSIQMTAGNHHEPDPFGDLTINTRTRPLTKDQQRKQDDMLERYKQELEQHYNALTPESYATTLKARMEQMHAEYADKIASLETTIGSDLAVRQVESESVAQNDSTQTAMMAGLAGVSGAALTGCLAMGLSRRRTRL